MFSLTSHNFVAYEWVCLASTNEEEIFNFTDHMVAASRFFSCSTPYRCNFQSIFIVNICPALTHKPLFWAPVCLNEEKLVPK